MSWFSPNEPRRSSSHHHDHDSRSHQDTRSQTYSRRSSSPKRQYTTSRGYTSSGTGRARPRDGYVNKMLSQIKRYLRRLYDYARRHPVKLLMMILPLLTGGALAGLLAKFGIRLPRGIEGMIGGKHGSVGGGSGMGGMGAMGGGGVEGMMKMAKMFM